MKAYNGGRNSNGTVTVIWLNELGRAKFLPHFLDLNGRDPVHPFDWGHGGIGADHLSAALIAHVLGPVYAEQYYEEYKRRVVAHFGYSSFRLSEFQIRDEVLKIDKEQKARNAAP